MSIAALLPDLRDAAVAALAAAGRPTPAVSYVSEGDVSYDCCDALIVELERLEGNSPTGPAANIGHIAKLATVAVHLLRCAAETTPEGPPATADIEAVGLGLAADLDALLSTDLGDCRLLTLVDAEMPRETGGDCAPLIVRWQVRP